MGLKIPNGIKKEDALFVAHPASRRPNPWNLEAVRWPLYGPSRWFFALEPSYGCMGRWQSGLSWKSTSISLFMVDAAKISAGGGRILSLNWTHRCQFRLNADTFKRSLGPIARLSACMGALEIAWWYRDRIGITWSGLTCNLKTNQAGNGAASSFTCRSAPIRPMYTNSRRGPCSSPPVLYIFRLLMSIIGLLWRMIVITLIRAIFYRALSQIARGQPCRPRIMIEGMSTQPRALSTL